MPVDELAVPGAHNVVERPGRGRGRAAVRHRARCDPRGGRGVHRRRAPARAGRRDRRRALRQRLAGHPARRGDRRAARLRRRRSCSSPAAARQGVDLAELGRRSSRERAVAAVLIGESGPALEAPRSERAGLGRRRGAPPPRATPSAAPTPSRARPSPRLGPAGDAAPDRRPCCSARPPRASTCSSTTPPGAGRSRRPSAALAATVPERPMNLAPPIPRLAATAPRAGRAAGRDRAGRQPDAGQVTVTSPSASATSADYADPRVGRGADRDRHPDGLLVVGACRATCRRTPTRSRRSVRRSAGRSSAWSRWSSMMRVDYRYLRLVSVPLYVVARRPARPRLRAAASTSSSAARRAGSGSDRCRPSTRPSSPSSRSIVYLAHWFAKRGQRDPRLLGGHRAVPAHRRAGHRCSCSRSPTSARPAVIDADRVHDVLRGRCQPHRSSSLLMPARASPPCRLRRPQRSLPARSGCTDLPRPWSDARRQGFHTVQGLLALGLGGLVGTGLGRAIGRRPVPAERLQRLHLRRSSARSSG